MVVALILSSILGVRKDSAYLVKILVFESNIFSNPILKAVLLVELDNVAWFVPVTKPDTLLLSVSAPLKSVFSFLIPNYIMASCSSKFKLT